MDPLSTSSSMVGRVRGPHMVPLSLRTQYCRTSPSAMRRSTPLKLGERRTLPPSSVVSKHTVRPAARTPRQGVAPSSAASPSAERHAASACCSAGGSKQYTSVSNTLHSPAGVAAHAAFEKAVVHP